MAASHFILNTGIVSNYSPSQIVWKDSYSPAEMEKEKDFLSEAVISILVIVIMQRGNTFADLVLPASTDQTRSNSNFNLSNMQIILYNC